MNLLRAFQDFVREQNFFAPDDEILLAVSGGIDSVALAHLLKKSGFRFAIAHCNFQLRGAESDADEKSVESLARKLEVKFFSQHFDTEAFAAKNGLSVQMAARELRYDWFEETRRKNGFSKIATAHNLDDSVETSVFNLIRGTGVSGLQGIPAVNGFVVRPLLFASRAEIEKFAGEENLNWREDSSNASDKYSRNFTRHHVLPKMRELNPEISSSVSRMQSRLKNLELNFGHLANLLKKEIFKSKNGTQHIDKQAVAKFPDPAAMLFHWLRDEDFTKENCRQIAENLDSHIGLEIQNPSGWRVFIDREFLILSPPKSLEINSLRIFEDDLMVSLPDGSKLFLMQNSGGGIFPDGKTEVLVNAAKTVFPMTLRNWLPGDAFQPFGMNGQRQKLQDFFVNQKVPRWEKERVWVLENGNGEIVWVLGYRLDERFRVVQNSDKTLKIKWLKTA